MQVGQLFQEVSEGQHTEQVLPYLLQAAPFAGVDRIPFQQALQTAVRDKRQVPAAQSPAAVTAVLMAVLSMLQTWQSS